MNTLTKNRILQPGDEYFEPKGGKGWRPVPKDNFGLQVQFTDYAEVRRPSEAPQILSQGSATATRLPHKQEIAGSTPAPAKPISPDSDSASTTRKVEKVVPAKAESDQSPVASHSATGDASPVMATLTQPDGTRITFPAMEARKVLDEHPASYLPTVVSTKAHRKHLETLYGKKPIITDQESRAIIDDIPYDQPMTDEETAALRREIDREKAVAIANAGEHLSPGALENFKHLLKGKPIANSTGSSMSDMIKIDFPHPEPGKDVPIWTGRNGTFNGYALDAIVVDDRIMLSPIGKRGVGNCTIQFPKAIIPQLVEWLQKQTPK